MDVAFDLKTLNALQYGERKKKAPKETDLQNKEEARNGIKQEWIRGVPLHK